MYIAQFKTFTDFAEQHREKSTIARLEEGQRCVD